MFEALGGGGGSAASPQPGRDGDADTLQYLVGAVDLKKKIVVRETSGIARVGRGQAVSGLDSSAIVHVPMRLPAGQYQLRVAVRSTRLGRGGSVYLQFEVPDFERLPLALSDLLIGSAAFTPAVHQRTAAEPGFSQRAAPRFASRSRSPRRRDRRLLALFLNRARR